MKFTVDYDMGSGVQRAVIGVQAQVGWELRTHKKIGVIAEGYAVTDMVGLLMEQLRIDGRLPEGVVNEATFARHLIDLSPVDPDEEVQDTQEVNGAAFPTEAVPSPTAP